MKLCKWKVRSDPERCKKHMTGLFAPKVKRKGKDCNNKKKTKQKKAKNSSLNVYSYQQWNKNVHIYIIYSHLWTGKKPRHCRRKSILAHRAKQQKTETLQIKSKVKRNSLITESVVMDWSHQHQKERSRTTWNVKHSLQQTQKICHQNV